MRVMIAGGGTGGHVYPGLAIYRALSRATENVEVLFVGATGGVEGRIFAGLGLPHVLLAGRGVRGTSLFSRLTSPFVLLAGTIGGVREVLAFKPDVVIGTGGYASVAVVLASVLCGKTRILQEQNSVPGLANRMLSRFADLVLLSFEESRHFISRSAPCAVVGNPLRFDVVPDREAALRFFELDSSHPVVLVFGGSRGAHAINEAATAAALRILERRAVQFVFLTGERDFRAVENMLQPHRRLVRVFPFLDAMQHAYSIADVAISRAGASSVFELAAFGVPTVFVPYPFAADDHQRKNVAELHRLDAAVVVDNAWLNPEDLEAIIVSLLDDHQRRKTMRGALQNWARTDAAPRAAEEILEVLRRGSLRLAQADRVADENSGSVPLGKGSAVGC